MSNHEKYGEPWFPGTFPRDLYEQVKGGRVIDEEDLDRAIACVNAMAGFDPQKVRKVIDLLLLAAVWCPGSDERCGRCWHCMFEDCRMEETEE